MPMVLQIQHLLQTTVLSSLDVETSMPKTIYGAPESESFHEFVKCHVPYKIT